MSKIKKIFKEQKKYVVIGGVALIAILYFVFGGGKDQMETYVVGRSNIEQSVVLSGKIQTSDRADLGFAASGRLQNVFVKNNQKVVQGQILAQLEVGDLLADLKIKQANSRTSDVSLESSKSELEKVTIEEDTKVESAYRTLLSDDLVLTPESNNYGVEAPTVTGIYDGLEGQYKVIIENVGSNSSDFQIMTFILEKTKKIINEEGSTTLGTKGLYISFPVTDLTPYKNTIWYLNIPQKASSAYLSNYNAYNETKKRRDSAIKEAESAYNKLLSENEGDDSGVAEAEIQKINAEIRKNTIYAPFGGHVTNIEKEVGESASVGERVISIIGVDMLEVVLQVSELDVSRLIPDSSIKISLDAFSGEEFYGILKTINSRETEVDGVSVYEAFVELNSDERIKTGMSASGTIIIATKNDVVAIPSYLVKKVGNLNTVEISTADGKIIEKEIVLGLLGTDSMIEIISGLNEGDKVVSVSK